MEVVHQKVEHGVLTPANAAPDAIGPFSTPSGAAHPLPAPPAIPDHELLKCIGRGSYGEVWLARNIMGVFRAIKIVYRASFDSDRPYHREFEGLRKFEPISRSHQSQVDVLHVGQGDGYFYYVMELADDAGENPKSEIRNPKQTRKPNAESAQPSEAVANSDFGIPSDFGLRNSDLYTPRTLKLELQRRGRLPFADCVNIGLALTTALEHLHKNGLIHRDIKPANIIFVDGLPKLADIGLVAAVDATCSFVGTEGYLPPEGPGTAQADLYSLGKVLYEISTGKERREFPELPLKLDSPEQTKGMMELNAVVLKACKPRLQDRYQSAGEMHRDLLLLLAGRSVRQTHDLERRLGLARRIALGTAAVLLLAVVPYVVAIKEAGQARRESAQARLAEADAKEKLWGSYLAQAKALRWSRQAGRRFEGLELVTKAAAIRPSLELRNEAIACLALPDMRLAREFSGAPPGGTTAETDVEFDMKGWRYARRDERGDITIRSLTDDRELVHLPGFGATVGAELNFSPDGHLLVAYAGGREEKVKPLIVWDLDRAKPVLSLTNDFVRTPDFTRDNSLIALYQYPSAKCPSALLVYDLANGREKASFLVPTLPANFKFHPDGRELAVSFTGSEKVKVLDVVSGEVTRELTGTAPIHNLAWHPEGRWLAAAGGDGNNVLWDMTTGERTVLKAHQSAASGICFSHEGNLLASTGWDGRLLLQDVLGGNEICSLPMARHVCVFSPDDRWLGCRPSRAGPGLIEVARGHECRWLRIEEAAGAEGQAAFSCVFSPDGQLLASAHWDGLRIWSVSGGRQLAFQPTVGRVFAVRFNSSGQALVTSGDDGVQTFPLQVNQAGSSNQAAILPALNLASPGVADWDCFGCAAEVFTVVSGGKVHVMELESKREKRLLAGEMTFLLAALSPNEKWCAAGSWFTNSVCVFDIQSGGTVHVLPGCESMGRLVFSPDSRHLVMCGSEEYRFWDTGPWRISGTIHRKATGEIRGCAAFSGDSRMAAVAYSGQVVRLVDPSTGSEFATLEARELKNIASLAFSPDGTKLAATTWGKTIQLWDLRLIRTELAALNLDWDLPPYPGPSSAQLWSSPMEWGVR